MNESLTPCKGGWLKWDLRLRQFRTEASRATGSQMTSPNQPIANAYELLIEAVVDYAIYMLDAEGQVASWNPGAERIKGYTAAEIIGQHFSRFYTE